MNELADRRWARKLEREKTTPATPEKEKIAVMFGECNMTNRRQRMRSRLSVSGSRVGERRNFGVSRGLVKKNHDASRAPEIDDAAIIQRRESSASDTRITALLNKRRDAVTSRSPVRRETAPGTFKLLRRLPFFTFHLKFFARCSNFAG